MDKLETFLHIFENILEIIGFQEAKKQDYVEKFLALVESKAIKRIYSRMDVTSKKALDNLISDIDGFDDIEVIKTEIQLGHQFAFGESLENGVGKSDEVGNEDVVESVPGVKDSSISGTTVYEDRKDHALDNNQTNIKDKNNIHSDLDIHGNVINNAENTHIGGISDPQVNNQKIALFNQRFAEIVKDSLEDKELVLIYDEVIEELFKK